MWDTAAELILRHRRKALAIILGLTVIMGYYCTKVKVMQEFAKVVPKSDPDYIEYESFKKEFGEDGNASIIGIETKSLFQPTVLQTLEQLTQQIEQKEGVERVVNILRTIILVRNDSLERFEIRWNKPQSLSNQAVIDSFRIQLQQSPFYRGLLFDTAFTVTTMAVRFTKEALNTKRKHILNKEIQAEVEKWANENQQQVHFAGLPVVRSYLMQKIPAELVLFMGLAVVVTVVTLFLFYRSLYAVVVPMILLAITAVWTGGILGLLEYKITILTGLLPPLIVVIGIPNSIYMLSDYHAEFKKCGNQFDAMRLMIQKLGLVTLMINANTALGFLTLYFTDVVPLQEFGMAAFLATTFTYVITVIAIPGIFSLLPEPSDKHLKHLDSVWLTKTVHQLSLIAGKGKPLIYGVTIVLCLISAIGMLRLKAVSYMVDDLPTHDRIITDLRWMESKFGGVMPFEIVIDTQKKKGLRNPSVLKKIDQFQQKLQTYPELSRSVSIVDGLKWSRQAYFGNEAEAYQVPLPEEMSFILKYIQFQEKEKQKNLLSVMTDSSFSKARITLQVRDIGSEQMPLLLQRIRADADSIFTDKKTQITLTGTTKLFLKANDYLVNNLYGSLLATFVIIGLQMYWLFNSFRIMWISLLVNMIPLMVTAGIMGFLDIPLKPSTALIYGVAFGIAIDNSIHFLAGYRGFRKKGLSVEDSVVECIKRTGTSIIYTSVVLFAGFIIFTPSAFGGTRALGILTSITLFIAMFSNLILLPAMIVSFDRRDAAAVTDHALIDEELELE
ncbi:MAG: MMPL family transporter [Bacteroidia bacterium]|nr:MMPL family transporter [Bacteroidia bacterium]